MNSPNVQTFKLGQYRMHYYFMFDSRFRSEYGFLDMTEGKTGSRNTGHRAERGITGIMIIESETNTVVEPSYNCTLFGKSNRIPFIPTIYIQLLLSWKQSPTWNEPLPSLWTFQALIFLSRFKNNMIMQRVVGDLHYLMWPKSKNHWLNGIEKECFLKFHKRKYISFYRALIIKASSRECRLIVFNTNS